MQLLTSHSRLRCAQRNISVDELDMVLSLGKEIRRTGVTFYFLGKRNVPFAARSSERMQKLVGTVLLVGDDDAIITVYRNESALRTILKKSKSRHFGRRPFSTRQGGDHERR